VKAATRVSRLLAGTCATVLAMIGCGSANGSHTGAGGNGAAGGGGVTGVGGSDAGGTNATGGTAGASAGGSSDGGTSAAGGTGAGGQAGTSGGAGGSAGSGAPNGGTSSTLMGVSASKYDHGGISKWDAMRVYSLAKVATAIQAGAKIVALSDDSGSPPMKIAGGQASANALDTWLSSFYTAHPNVEVDFANGNEVDTGTNVDMAGFAATYAAMRQVIDKYPKASLWIDLTHYKISQGVSDAFMQAAAPYLDGVAASIYPPGRKQSPIVWSAYPSFVNDVFQIAAKYGIRKVALWETGIGPDVQHNDANHRPYYAAHLAKYVYEYAQQNGFELPVMLWWDSIASQANAPDDILSDDLAGANPSTAEAWKNWQSYFPAYGGATPSTWTSEPPAGGNY
jgi:hypothetical protein